MTATPSAPPEQPAAQVADALVRLGLAPRAADVRLSPLTGGVSSDIWRAELPDRSVCVKRALPRLRVAALWEAPVERNAYEVAWMRVAARIVPEAVPALLAHDPAGGLFVMAYLDPQRYPLWKAALLRGDVSPEFAAQVGDTIGRIHSATAAMPQLAREFATDAIFRPIRLEPYLVATAARHPDCADALERLVAVTASTRLALVHGDVSPKNILAGPAGPVLLDAECAWWGDPAFDLAFCLNHLLLKCVPARNTRQALADAYAALTNAYLARVDWESPAALERRTAALLPGLFLGRIDGKSPVEYIVRDEDRELVRGVARRLLRAPVERLGDVAATWQEALHP
jgi:aminoglycoside phosphotransferase (APT) family kinase protein